MQKDAYADLEFLNDVGSSDSRKKPQLSRTFFLFRCFFFLEAFFDDKDDERASRNKQRWKITDTSYKLL